MVSTLEKQAKKLPVGEQLLLAQNILANVEEVESTQRGLDQAKQGIGSSHAEVMKELRARIDAARPAV